MVLLKQDWLNMIFMKEAGDKFCSYSNLNDILCFDFSSMSNCLTVTLVRFQIITLLHFQIHTLTH